MWRSVFYRILPSFEVSEQRAPFISSVQEEGTTFLRNFETYLPYCNTSLRRRHESYGYLHVDFKA
jgi:hypothetical protein